MHRQTALLVNHCARLRALIKLMVQKSLVFSHVLQTLVANVNMFNFLVLLGVGTRIPSVQSQIEAQRHSLNVFDFGSFSVLVFE